MTAGADLRSVREIGRRARLELVFGVSAGRTVLRRAYVEPPLRVGGVFPEGSGVHVILASSAPGLFGGDLFEQSFIVEEGARVRLTSQSALQVHPNRDGSTAVLRSEYRVEAGARLQCEWDPLIPFPEARLDQRIAIDLAAGGSFVWSDAVMSGREASGERWQFTSLAHELWLVRNGALDYLERYSVVPGSRNVRRPWLAGEACYFGTVLASGEGNPASAERIHTELEGQPGVLGSADVLGRDLLLIRLMATSGVAFHDARAQVIKMCATWATGPSGLQTPGPRE